MVICELLHGIGMWAFNFLFLSFFLHWLIFKNWFVFYLLSSAFICRQKPRAIKGSTKTVLAWAAAQLWLFLQRYKLHTPISLLISYTVVLQSVAMDVCQQEKVLSPSCSKLSNFSSSLDDLLSAQNTVSEVCPLLQLLYLILVCTSISFHFWSYSSQNSAR